MKTKYILHGGSAQKVNGENDAFIQEILRDVPTDAKILLVYFAVGPDNYELNRIKDEANFDRNKDDKKMRFEVADEHRFVDQVGWADVVYIGGGTTPDLLGVLTKFSDLGKLFAGKIIAGESAGANALAEYGYSPTLKKWFKGLGLVPVVMVPHDDGNELDGIPDGELLELADYKYQVYWI